MWSDESEQQRKIRDLETQCHLLKHRNEKLEESGNIYASIFDHSPVGHVILDTRGVITDANLTVASLVEVPIESMVGLPFHVLIAKQETTRFFAHLHRCRTSNTKTSTEFVLKTASHHTYCIQVISIPFIHSGDQCLYYNTTIVDITPQKQLEKEIEKLDRFNLIGEMAASIAHEIRNPMTTVHGYLQLFKRKSASLQKTNDLTFMINELDRVNEIIAEFLALTKNPKTELQLQNINHIILTIYPLLQAESILTGKEIFLELFPHLPEILIDTKQIRQLLCNLVTNGMQAMVQGQVTIRTFMENGKIILAVADQGHGIPTELQDKIGTPFFTTKATGTGLGLAICYSTAQSHHAELDFETSPYGTTFYVRFPRVAG